MIIGYDFFGLDFSGNIYDTAIPTSGLDELTLGAGIYDELFISVDTTIDGSDTRPKKWMLKNIMHSKFQNDLEAGTLDADGHIITSIQIYRRKYMVDNNWLLMGEFPLDEDYNVYTLLDRLTQNDTIYEYSVVPVANDVIGEVSVSDPVKANFEGIYISDLENNVKMEYDLNLGDVDYNNNTSTINPLNGKYPIVINGNQRYRSGSINFTPLSENQITLGGTTIKPKEEADVRRHITDFLQNNSAKVIRKDDGDIFVVATSNIKSQSKNGKLVDIHEVSFDYTEIGDMNYETMSKGGLIGSAAKSKYTFDENGEIVWEL